MADWIASLIGEGGYLTIALLMFLENLFPPIPSELVMPLAGYAAHRGDMNLALVALSGSAGSLAGALFWYGIGIWVGCDRLRRFAGRHGRWLTLSPRDVDRVDAWFDRHGGEAVFFGRLVPAVRTLISVPAGLSGMPMNRFFAYTAAGTMLWTSLLAGAGWTLGAGYETVGRYVDPVSNAIIVAIVIAYLYRVVTFRAEARP